MVINAAQGGEGGAVRAAAVVVVGGVSVCVCVSGCVCFVPLCYFLVEDFDMDRALKGGAGTVAAATYKKLSWSLAGLWCAYPVVSQAGRQASCSH